MEISRETTTNLAKTLRISGNNFAADYLELLQSKIELKKERVLGDVLVGTGDFVPAGTIIFTKKDGSAVGIIYGIAEN